VLPASSFSSITTNTWPGRAGIAVVLVVGRRAAVLVVGRARFVRRRSGEADPEPGDEHAVSSATHTRIARAHRFC
jgi:hypothetical protein